jgi:hypothetical protein
MMLYGILLRDFANYQPEEAAGSIIRDLPIRSTVRQSIQT